MSKNKEMGNDITVIIPVFNIDSELFTNAIDSIKAQIELPDEVLIVVGKDTDDHKVVLKENYDGLNVRLLDHSESTSFASQMNLGVKYCNTKWFSFLEQDDEMSKIWLKNAIDYRKVYTDIDIFLPIIIDVDKEGKLAGLSNQAAWAHTFSEEMGILDNAALLSNQNFNFGGMVMNQEIYLEFGGIKENVKLTFMYEFLLRMTFNSNKVMIIPKLGYKHINMREGGLFDNYISELSPEESTWWLEMAKKEYFHIHDRGTQYEKKV